MTAETANKGKSPLDRLTAWVLGAPHREVRIEIDGHKRLRMACIQWLAGDRHDFAMVACALVGIDRNIAASQQKAATRCLSEIYGASDPTRKP